MPAHSSGQAVSLGARWIGEPPPRPPLIGIADQELCADDLLGEQSIVAGASPSSELQRRLKPGEAAKLVAGYKAGTTARELAAQFGIHRNTGAAHLAREGVPTRQRGLQPGQVDEVTRLYDQGWSTVKLGKKFGVSNPTISAALRNSGIPIRTRPAPQRSSP